MVGREIYYEGHVQGVGFRYTVKQIAMGFDVTGWIKNLADGRVQMLAVGETAELEEFLEEVRDSVLGGHIRREEAHEVTAPDGLTGFSIAH